MYVSSKLHLGKRAGLKNRGYFDIEDDYEDFERMILHDIHVGPEKMKNDRPERIRKNPIFGI